MKPFKSILVFIALFATTINFAQTSHPTISEVSVKYKSTAQFNSQGEFQVIPEASVSFAPTSAVSKIFLKIVDPANNSTVYEVNYDVSSTTVTNSQGLKLFENQNGVIFISSGSAITLKPYNYEVYTQDSQSASTPVFSVIQ